jgi:hypothetical protein
MIQVLLLIGCFFLVSCDGAREQLSAPLPNVTLMSPSGSEFSVQVEIADDAPEREKGLMFRDRLALDTGMLFIFPQEQMLGFWMKNTLIPLDVIYFDANGDFVSFQEMEPCTSDPCPMYSSFAAAQYALEVPRGYAKEHGVGIGWRLVRE